jgi:hypothetical protein
VLHPEAELQQLLADFHRAVARAKRVHDHADLLVARPAEPERFRNETEPAVGLRNRQREIVQPSERRDKPFVDPRCGSSHPEIVAARSSRNADEFAPKCLCNRLLLSLG